MSTIVAEICLSCVVLSLLIFVIPAYQEAYRLMDELERESGQIRDEAVYFDECLAREGDRQGARAGELIDLREGDLKDDPVFLVLAE